MSRADALWESYLNRIGGLEMYQRDAAYRFQFDVLLGMVKHLEVVLDDEGIAPGQADRILRCVLYGAPTVADAEQRVRDYERMVEIARKLPPDISSVLEQLDLPPMKPGESADA